MTAETAEKTSQAEKTGKGKTGRQNWQDRVQNGINRGVEIVKGGGRAVYTKTTESIAMAEIISNLDWAMHRIESSRTMASPGQREKYDKLVDEYVEFMVSLDKLAAKICKETNSMYRTPRILLKRQKQIDAEKAAQDGGSGAVTETTGEAAGEAAEAKADVVEAKGDVVEMGATKVAKAKKAAL